MNVSITARHCELSASIRQRADKRIKRLTRFEPRVTSADLIFDTDREAKRVEARVFVAGGRTSLAEGTAETFQAALDRVTDRLTRQLKRARERQRDHKAKKLSELAAPLIEDDEPGENADR